MSEVSRPGSRKVRVVLVVGATVLLSLGVAAPQFNNPNNQTAAPQMDHDLDRNHLNDQEPFVAREMQARQLKRLREEHQKQVLSDTARLVELATALKAEVDKGAKAAPDVRKEVDEIGKLAKRVSERIRTQ